MHPTARRIDLVLLGPLTAEPTDRKVAARPVNPPILPDVLSILTRFAS